MRNYTRQNRQIAFTDRAEVFRQTHVISIECVAQVFFQSVAYLIGFIYLTDPR